MWCLEANVAAALYTTTGTILALQMNAEEWGIGELGAKKKVSL